MGGRGGGLRVEVVFEVALGVEKGKPTPRKSRKEFIRTREEGWGEGGVGRGEGGGAKAALM